MTNIPANEILRACQKWLDNVIIAHNICPFAKRTRDCDTIRYSLATSSKLEPCLQMVADELIYLDDNPDTETSLLIFAQGFEDFDSYLELLELAQEVLLSLNYEGRYQLASFHPDYCFEGCLDDDVENYTNRSPYPLLHILREDSLTVAIDNHPDPESIPQRNIDLTKAERARDAQGVVGELLPCRQTMNDFLTTREVARLLRIKERKVYDLASSGKIPCSKVTGKLLFPKAEIDQWLTAKSSHSNIPERPAVLLGSHDPLLEWALRASGCGIACFFDGSLDGIDRYLNGEGIATGLHIYERTGQQWNTPVISEKLGSQNITSMEWARRQRGFILSNDCSQNIQSIEDLKALTIVPRQAGAGSQILLESLMLDANLDESELTLLEAERTESDAILPILQGRAHVTLGLATVAEQYKLKFVPVIDERYDLVVDRRYWFEPAWQTFLDFCHSEIFIAKAITSTGYNVGKLGTIHYNGK